PAARVALTSRNRRAARPRERRIDADLRAAIGRADAHAALSASDLAGERVGRDEEEKTPVRMRARRDAAAAGEGLVGAFVADGVVVDQGDGPAWVASYRREAAVVARQPEAHAALVGERRRAENECREEAEIAPPIPCVGVPPGRLRHPSTSPS